MFKISKLILLSLFALLVRPHSASADIKRDVYGAASKVNLSGSASDLTLYHGREYEGLSNLQALSDAYCQ